MKDVSRLSDELVDALLATDHVAIGTPVCNDDVPAVLEAYIDHIVRKGRTLGFAGEGLVHGKACTLRMASGGVYTEGSPLQALNVATSDLRLVSKVIGMTTARSSRAERESRGPGAGHARSLPGHLRRRHRTGGDAVVTAALRPASGGSSRSAIDHRIDDVGSVRASSAPASRTTGRVAGSHRPSSALPLDAARSASDPTPDASRQLSPHSARTRWTAGRASIRSKCAWTLPGSGMSIIGAQRST